MIAAVLTPAALLLVFGLCWLQSLARTAAVSLCAELCIGIVVTLHELACRFFGDLTHLL